MAPGGWLCVGFPNRWYPAAPMRAGSLSLSAALSTVRQAGLARPEIYAALPDQRHAAFLVPLTRPAEMDHMLRALFQTSFPAGGRGVIAIRRVVSVLRRIALASPRARRHLMPAVLPRRREAAVIGAVCARINAIAASHGLPRVTGGIVIAVDYAPAAKATLLLFGTDGRPCLVAKLARSPETERVLVAERAALLDVWSARPSSVTAELPRPVALERVSGRLVLLSTAVPGTPLTMRYYAPGHVRHPGRVAADLAAAGSWLGRFQRETRSGTIVLGPGAFEDWIRPTFDRYRTEAGWGSWEADLLDHLSDLCGLLAGTRVPVVAVHGDYALGNILLDQGRVSGVVDWELGRGAGLPFSDLFKFAASYGSYLDRACPPARGSVPGHPGWSRARDRWGATPGWANGTGILYTFFGSGWFPELVHSFLRVHLRRLQVPPAAVELFFPVFLAEQVLAVEQPAYRNGYRGLLRLVWEESAAGKLRLPVEAAG